MPVESLETKKTERQIKKVDTRLDIFTSHKQFHVISSLLILSHVCMYNLIASGLMKLLQIPTVTTCILNV